MSTIRQMEPQALRGSGRRGWASSFLRSLVLRRLGQLQTGAIVLREGTERRLLGQPDKKRLTCELTVRDPRFFGRVARGGSIGATESYVDGDWSVDDLTELIRILARDALANRRLDTGLARRGLLVDRLRHLLRDNTVRRSRRNIAAHYDLGNEFFRSFLDPTMTYSCGIFEDETTSLEQASRAKIDLICRKLELHPELELLEIGSGWGSLALHAAREYGCRVVTTTISRRQYEYTRRLMCEAGVGDRVTVLLEDYRRLVSRLERRFDRLVSIEMIEAVGHRHLGEYFRTCQELLKPEGSMLLQAIVIADQQYESYRRSVDFIQRHIFPGGCLPSLTAISAALTRHTDLRIGHLQDISRHYPPTLRLWRRRFTEREGKPEIPGIDERLRRLWEFYFCYSEAGFLERNCGTVQLLLNRPQARVPEHVPQT